MFKSDDKALYTAWQAFQKGKRRTLAIDMFAYAIEENLQLLSRDIRQQSYKHGPYTRIVAYEKKRRYLAVASVRDRVLHRLLYDYLVKVYDIQFDPDVWSCRKGKGLHACIARTQQLLVRHSDAYIWRTDISKFFDHVDHSVLRQCLKRRISDEKVLWLCDQVIGSYTSDRQTDRQTDRNSDWQFDESNIF